MRILHAFYFLLFFTINFYSLNSHAQCLCNGSFYNQEYNAPQGWLKIDNTGGTMSILGGTCNFRDPMGGDYNRIYTHIPALETISNSFTAECEFTAISGNAPGHHIMAFTQNSNDPISTNGSGYPFTNNDALMVELEAAISPPPSGTCCTDPNDPSSPWLFRVRYKKGTVLTTDPAGIPIPSLNTTYYIRLERINSGQGSLSIYSDLQFSQHVPGSPICFSMDNTIGPFRFLHQGVITYASHYRTLRAVVDNLHICSGTSCSSCQGRISAAEETGKDIINVYPNPSSGKFSIFVRSINANSKADILIFNFCGQELRQYSSTANGNELITFDLDDQPAGLYFISVTTDQEKYISRLIIE